MEFVLTVLAQIGLLLLTCAAPLAFFIQRLSAARLPDLAPAHAYGFAYRY